MKKFWKVLLVIPVLALAIVALTATFETPPAEAGICYDNPGHLNGYGEGRTCPQAKQACRADVEARAELACVTNGANGTYFFESISYDACEAGQTQRKGRSCHLQYNCYVCPGHG